MNNCVFCRIITKKEISNIVFEDKKVLVILDRDDAIKGHLLVIWKKHCLNISDLTEKEYLHFSKILYRTEKIVLKMLKKEKSVILKSGGLFSHFHFHIYVVNKNTKWSEIKDMFDKKIKYTFKLGEKKKLNDNLQKLFN